MSTHPDACACAWCQSARRMAVDMARLSPPERGLASLTLDLDLGVDPAIPGTDQTVRMPWHSPLPADELADPPPAALPGSLCERCLDAPAARLAPAPWGGDMGVCDACGAQP
jgi:hypothetical protein